MKFNESITSLIFLAISLILLYLIYPTKLGILLFVGFTFYALSLIFSIAGFVKSIKNKKMLLPLISLIICIAGIYLIKLILNKFFLSY
jgi:hypothetical protein